MTTGSIGSHRSFMGVSLTLCACLVLALYVGWQIYFANLAKRNALVEIDHRNEEARSADLQKMGLLIDAGATQPAVPDAVHLVMSGRPAAPPAPAARVPAPPPAAATQTGGAAAPSAPAAAGATYPGFSNIKQLPLLETAPEVAQAVTLLEKYWATPAWQDRQPLVVDGGRVAPLMRDFYEVQKGADPVPNGLISKARYSIDGVEILYFRYNGNRSSGTVEVAMRRGNEGRFLIDWESLAGYGEMSFEKFREQRPAKPVLLRVFARQFEYYNFEFSDASKYLCVKLSSPDGEQSIYAYAERSSPLGDWLSTSLVGTGPTATLGFTVRVAFPPEAQSSQCVQLLEVVASRWLVMP